MTKSQNATCNDSHMWPGSIIASAFEIYVEGKGCILTQSAVVLCFSVSTFSLDYVFRDLRVIHIEISRFVCFRNILPGGCSLVTIF